MFSITMGKGFQLTFENGCTLSVQFGPENYCQRRGCNFDAPRKASRWKSQTAEVAILYPNGDFYPIHEYEVEGWQTVEDVCRWIEVARNLVPTAEQQKVDSAEEVDA